jgi:hypothetical protein
MTFTVASNSFKDGDYLPSDDAWVFGDKPCVLIDFTGMAKYAKPA